MDEADASLLVGALAESIAERVQRSARLFTISATMRAEESRIVAVLNSRPFTICDVRRYIFRRKDRFKVISGTRGTNPPIAQWKIVFHR